MKTAQTNAGSSAASAAWIYNCVSAVRADKNADSSSRRFVPEAEEISRSVLATSSMEIHARNAVSLALAEVIVGLVSTPFMRLSYVLNIPVTAPPVGAALLAGATVRPELARPATWVLRLLTGVGLAGAGLHAYGIQRNMGGWRNWSQNVLNGPPLPAPPAFTALAIAGLAALKLMERER